MGRLTWNEFKEAIQNCPSELGDGSRNFSARLSSISNDDAVFITETVKFFNANTLRSDFKSTTYRITPSTFSQLPTVYIELLANCRLRNKLSEVPKDALKRGEDFVEENALSLGLGAALVLGGIVYIASRP